MLQTDGTWTIVFSKCYFQSHCISYSLRNTHFEKLILLSSSIIKASVLSHAASCRRVFILEKASSIQYGYRKYGTHARVFCRTLAHGNGKIELRQLKIKGKKAKKKGMNVERSTVGTKKSRQPKRQKSLNLVQSRQSLTTVLLLLLLLLSQFLLRLRIYPM